MAGRSSLAGPGAFDRGGGSIMVECGRHARYPCCPLANSIAAVPKAVPRQIVSMSGET